MQPARNLLHKSKLADFATWCLNNGHCVRPGGGDYQVLQVELNKKFIPIYEKISSTEHYTVPGALIPLVTNFIREKKGD